MIVWLMESGQKRHRLIDRSFRPCFYVHGPEGRLAPLAAALPARAPVSCALTERQNIWDRQPLGVLQVCAHHPTLFAPLARFVRRFDSGLVLYDSDLMLAPMYCWEKNIFPLAQVEVEADPAGEIRAITCRDDEWRTLSEDYHWHIEIVPDGPAREVVGGFAVNPVPPEVAATQLRDAA